MNVKGGIFFCSQELGEGMLFELHILTAFHFNWHSTRVRHSCRFKVMYVPTWNWFYPVFVTNKMCDRGGKTLQPILILLILYLPLLTFVNVVITAFTFSEKFFSSTDPNRRCDVTFSSGLYSIYAQYLLSILDISQVTRRRELMYKLCQLAL